MIDNKIKNIFILKHDIDGSKRIEGYDIGFSLDAFNSNDYNMEFNYNTNNDGSLISGMRNWKITTDSLPDFAFNLGFGACIHDGDLQNSNKTMYSSRLLFKTNVGFQFKNLELFGWHISNANLKKPNEGNTALGIRYHLK